MADPQEIKSIVETVIGKVFDKRISELRKDLHRGVGESLESRVSELQLDVETGLAEMFSSRVQEIREQIAKKVGGALKGQIGDLHKEMESGVADVINARTVEIRNQIEQGVGEALKARAADIRKDVEANVGTIFERRIAELRGEIEKTVEDSAAKRIQELQKDVEHVVGEKSEHRIAELRKDVHDIILTVANKCAPELRETVERVVGETADQKINELRKDVERVVGEVAENRVVNIRKDVEKVVAEAGEQRVEELRKELVNKVMQELEPALRGKAPETPVAARLEAAISKIHDSSSQTDILRALLDGAAHFSSRVALFVVKEDSAAGWQARGFEDNNNSIKKVQIECGSGMAGRAIKDRALVTAAASQFDSRFVAQFGAPKDGHSNLLPLLVRNKIPALIYADAGTRGDGGTDASALQVMVRAAGLWLEILTLRKAAGASPTESSSAEISASVVHEEPPHAQAAAAAAAQAAPAPVAEPHAREEESQTAIAPQDEEVHKKARRFAKLLVDEIKLYNQAKVNEGRQRKDLYNRLKEDIEKSRTSYEKRYGSTAAAQADYFTQEVIKTLAENNVALLGNGFPR